MSKKKKQIPKQEAPKIKQIQEKKNFLAFTEHAKMGWILSGIYFILMSIISFTYHKIGDYGIETDFFWSYVPQAQSFLDGMIEIDKYRGPLYPIVLALFQTITGNYFSAGILIAVLSSSLVIFFVYSILRKLFNPLVAFITTILMAVNTTFNLYTYSAGTDMFFNCLVSAALFFLLAKKDYRWKHLIFAGLFAGLAYITRYNGIFIVITSVVVILLINLYKLDWVKRFIATGIFTGIFVLIILPWGMYTHKEKGKAFWNQNYQNVAYEYLAKGEMGWDEFWYQGNRDKYTSLTQVILKEPGKFIKQFVSNGFDHLGKDMASLIGWHVALFSLIGLLLLLVKPPSKAQWAYYLASLLFFGVIMLVFYSERFSLFLIPFYTVFGVNALFTENKYLKDKIVKSPVLISLIAGILVIWTFSNSYAYNSENINSGDKNLLKLKEQFDKVEPASVRGDKILSRKAHIAYYLGLEMPWIPLTNNYYEQMALIWRNDVDYVSYGIWEMGRGLNFLQDPNKVPPNFELIAYSSVKNKVLGQKEENNQTYIVDVKRQQQPAMLYKIKIDSAEQQIIRAGNWMNEHFPFKDHPEVKEEKVMATLPFISFYVNRKFEEMPEISLDDLYTELKNRNIRYLYLGKHETSQHPELAALLDPDAAPTGLVPLVNLAKNTQYPAILYEVK
ncbi:ArnT family glycosyltransferase [Bacteroidota bacterium]